MDFLDYSNIKRGTRGIFEDIEKQANRFCSKCLILMAAFSFFLIIIASAETQSAYMAEVRIADSINIILGFGIGIYCQVRKTGTRYRKYVLFLTWFIELTIIVTFVDPGAMLLYAIPIVLAICYHSVIFTLFTSVVNIIFAFFPYIINTYRGVYRMGFIVLEPGTMIPITEASLEEAIYSLDTGIDRSATIINMLLYGYLTTVLALVALAVMAVTVTAYNRKEILATYSKSRNLMEEQLK